MSRKNHSQLTNNMIGFTLVEMLAVIGILSLLAVITIPSVIYLVRGKNEEINDVLKQSIFQATESFMDKNKVSYPKTSGNTYCISLKQLANAGEIATPVKNFSDGNEIPLNTMVKVSINTYNDPSFCLTGYEQNCDVCEEVRI